MNTTATYVLGIIGYVALTSSVRAVTGWKNFKNSACSITRGGRIGSVALSFHP